MICQIAIDCQHFPIVYIRTTIIDKPEVEVRIILARVKELISFRMQISPAIPISMIACITNSNLKVVTTQRFYLRHLKFGSRSHISQ